MVTLRPKSIASLAVLRSFASARRGVGRRSAARSAPSHASSDAPPSGWDLALTGGFVATGLVDPVYALGNVTGQPTRVVLRQPDQESTRQPRRGDVRAGLPRSVSWVAPLSFGIGLRGDSRATFYLGSALRFGPHASFTGGVAIGPVAALPAGVVEGRAGDRHELPRRTSARERTHSWFTGVTYTFASIR